MPKKDASCASPPTPKVTNPGPVLFRIGCQMATLTATAMAMGAHCSEIQTVEHLHYMKNESHPFAATRAKSITFEFYDHDHAPPLFTAPHNLTVEDCICCLTTGVCYSDVHGGMVDRVEYSVPSSCAPSPPSSEAPTHSVPIVYLVPLSCAPPPEAPTCPILLTESSISYTHSDYEDLTDQLNSILGLDTSPTPSADVAPSSPAINDLPSGITQDAATRWFVVFKGFQGWHAVKLMVVGARGARYNKCHSEEVALCLFTAALLLPLDEKVVME